MGQLTLREALASRQLDVFVREQQDNGAELVAGSELCCEAWLGHQAIRWSYRGRSDRKLGQPLCASGLASTAKQTCEDANALEGAHV